MFLSALHVMLAATLCLGCVEGYINNFRFRHSNVFKGDILPFTAQLTGTYYLDVLGTPELSYLTDLNKQGVVTAEHLRNHGLPTVCTGDTAGMIAALDGKSHNASSARLKALESKIHSGASDATIGTLMYSWGPYLDTSDPKYACLPLSTTIAWNVSGGYTFTLTVTFDNYKPIVFVDALGVGLFTYKRAFEATRHSGHRSGNPVRFCGGVDYTGDMYTFEPRPKCPTTTPKDARHHGRAMITVFKPNIVSVRRSVTRCVQHVTHVHAYENIFGTSRDAWKKARTAKTTPADCREWKRTKNACGSFSRSSMEEDDDISPRHYHMHPNQCRFVEQHSQNQAAQEYMTDPYLQYHYSGGDVNTYDMRSAMLTEGFMEVSMPTTTMVTPWMTIPKEFKSKGEYEINNVTLVWDAFEPDDLCLYVPRFRGEVSYIKYKHSDYNVPLDPINPASERYTMFLMADHYGAMFNVDSDQRITNVSALNCMPHKTDFRTTVYQSGTDQIIMVTVVDEGNTNRYDTSHIPEPMRHMGVDEQAHSGFSEIRYDPKTKSVHGATGENSATHVNPTRTGDISKVHDLATQFSSVKRSDKSGFTQTVVPPTQPTDLTSVDTINYVLYQQTEIQKENMHIRAQQNCFINQLDWDVYTQLLDLNPSRAISTRLNMAVEASHGGNSFYNVKMCELAVDVVVIPTLRTSSEEPVTVGGKATTVKEIVKTMGVAPDPEKCFAMPLVVFTSSLSGIQVVGQLSLEGIVRIDRMSYLEACGKNKAHIFMVGDYGHFFFDYAKNFTERYNVVRNATDRFLQATMHIRGGESAPPGSSRRDIAIAEFRQHALSKIHTLTIVQPTNLKEKEYRHYPTGLFSNNLYSVAEMQSVSLGLMKVMEEQNYERFAMKEFAMDWGNDVGSSDSGIFHGSEKFLEGSGDFFLKLGEGGGALLYGLGGGLGQTLKGAGEGVGAAGKGIFSGIGDALKGTILTLALPLIAVAVLAIVGVIIYKKLTGQETPPPSPPPQDEADPPHPPQYAFDPPNTTKQRPGFNFGGQ